VHDELVFEVATTDVDTVRALIVEEMVSAYALDPPLVADAGVGATWAAAKE
jgi:DNA polymerase-1